MTNLFDLHSQIIFTTKIVMEQILPHFFLHPLPFQCFLFYRRRCHFEMIVKKRELISLKDPSAGLMRAVILNTYVTRENDVQRRA